MKTQVLFIQGTGEEGYQEDRKLVDSLKADLGQAYEVHYPAMPDADNPKYAAWKDQIAKQSAALEGKVVLVGHSLGASLLLKWLSEAPPAQVISGLFLLAPPYWDDPEWRIDEYVLRQDFAQSLPAGLPVFFYHCEDDEVVPFAHLALYESHLPQATIRAQATGGHQIGNDLAQVAQDIRHLVGQ
jgi:uncharacterized protein